MAKKAFLEAFFQNETLLFEELQDLKFERHFLKIIKEQVI